MKLYPLHLPTHINHAFPLTFQAVTENELLEKSRNYNFKYFMPYSVLPE